MSMNIFEKVDNSISINISDDHDDDDDDNNNKKKKK
jgi:hypothetical protein